LTDDTLAAADTRTFTPSTCDAVPVGLQRSAENCDSEGDVYAITVIALVVDAVRPRLSVTVTVMVLSPATVSTLEVKLSPE